MVQIWTEKYRPKTLDDYVWTSIDQQNKVMEWIEQGALPNLLFSGVSGTGKTSLAELLLIMLDIPEVDILKINAVKERQVDKIQDKLENFVTTWAFGDSGIKYVIFDEAQSISSLGQRFLLSETEKYSETVRFIFTVNDRNKIITPLLGRVQEFTFKALELDLFEARALTILENENVDFDYDTFKDFSDRTFPDLRKCINLLQQKTIGGKLTKLEINDETANAKDYLIEAANLFQQKRVKEARTLIVNNAAAEDYDDIYRFFYRNLDLFGDTNDQQDQALLIIKQGLVDHSIIADPEINLAATLCMLTQIRN